MGPDTTILLNYGVLGVFAAILIALTRALLAREQRRADAEHAENLRLNALIQSEVIPSMIAATQAVSASQVLLAGIQRDLDIQKAAKTLIGGNVD